MSIENDVKYIKEVSDLKIALVTFCGFGIGDLDEMSFDELRAAYDAFIKNLIDRGVGKEIEKVLTTKEGEFISDTKSKSGTNIEADALTVGGIKFDSDGNISVNNSNVVKPTGRGRDEGPGSFQEKVKDYIDKQSREGNDVIHLNDVSSDYLIETGATFDFIQALIFIKNGETVQDNKTGIIISFNKETNKFESFLHGEYKEIPYFTPDEVLITNYSLVK